MSKVKYGSNWGYSNNLSKNYWTNTTSTTTNTISTWQDTSWDAYNYPEVYKTREVEVPGEKQPDGTYVCQYPTAKFLMTEAEIERICNAHVQREVDRRIDLLGPAPMPPPPREFNRYINGSDMLEEFIEFLDSEKVSKQDALELPIDLFIKWLIIRACEADQEEVPKDVKLELPSGRCRRSTRAHWRTRCTKCQSFVSPVRHCKRCFRQEMTAIGRQHIQDMQRRELIGRQHIQDMQRRELKFTASVA